MKNKPLISIGMAAYNGQQFIEKGIKSLLLQTYVRFELIISDDASTDKTQFICQKYAQKDSRIRYIRQKKNLGFRNNFNFVLEQAKGSYFIWASSDDFWHKNFIKELLSLLLKNPDAILAMCNFDNVKNGVHYPNAPSVQKGKTDRFYSLLNFINKGDLSYFYGLHKTENLKKTGGYIASTRPFFKSSDYLTIFKVLLEGTMEFTNKVLFYKGETGLYFERYQVLKDLDFNYEMAQKIVRYICFPILFIYDAVTSTKYLIFSDFSFTQKVSLIFYVVVHYLSSNINFAKDVAIGLLYVIIGITQNLSKFLLKK